VKPPKLRLRLGSRKRRLGLKPVRPPRKKRWAVARKLGAISAAGAFIIPAQAMVKGVAPKSRSRLPILFHRLTCQSLGIKVRLHGNPLPRGGVLFVSNHLSWSDIPVLGSKLAASFVSKAEVGGWGILGYLSRLDDTIYVERQRRQAAGEQRNAIFNRLAGGGRVILFPEGTNSDGTRVLPFKSSLFSVLEGPGSEDFLVQPVSLAYTRVNGVPVTRAMLPQVAWVGDVELSPHIADFMRLGAITAEILVHPPLRRSDFPSRKELARAAQEIVASGYAQLMRGDSGDTARAA
jgi:1-acyl-sn-glycerol-3-phosphate acyltransferase